MSATSLPDTDTAGSLATAMRALGQQAREAARALARASSAQKSAALLAAAAAIRTHRDQILAANARDMAAAQTRNLSAALLDRLALDAKRVEAMAAGIEAVAACRIRWAR
jgi:glutamate-5-semialdehyde dehydrogenase